MTLRETVAAQLFVKMAPHSEHPDLTARLCIAWAEEFALAACRAWGHAVVTQPQPYRGEGVSEPGGACERCGAKGLP